MKTFAAPCAQDGWWAGFGILIYRRMKLGKDKGSNEH